MFEEIGSIKNEADENSLQFLALFKDSLSEIRLKEPGLIAAYFRPEYSHYFVVHTPLGIQFSEKREEWNLRFSREVGVSIVEFVGAENENVYVRGLMAANGARVYDILPFTAIDSAKAGKAKFLEDRMARMRGIVSPIVLSEIKGDSILDIGSGFGSFTLELAKNNPDSKVYGIDVHDSLVSQAKMNARISRIQNVEFKTGSAYSLPFENERIDAAMCFLMLHHLEDMRYALFEIKRVLRKGGMLIAVEPLANQHHHGPQLSEEEWKELFEEVGFNVEIQSLEGAAVVKAVKRD
ncbi:MAG: class I SAM-dependent methyltransferase [Methanosarcina sp.]